MRTYCPGDLVPIQFNRCDPEEKVLGVTLCLTLLNGQRASRDLDPSTFDDESFLIPDDVTSHIWQVWITTGYYREATSGERGTRTKCHVLSINIAQPRVKVAGTFTGENTRPLIQECC